MVRRAPGRAYLLVAVVATALVLTLVVATVATGSVFAGPRHAPPDHVDRHVSAAGLHRAGIDLAGIPKWLGPVLMALLVATVLAMVLLGRAGRHVEPDRLVFEEEDDLGAADWEGLLSVELGAAATEQLVEMTHGSPRNAIVACWLRLQEATERAGLPIEPTETSREFTIRALRRLHLDDTAITTLAELYREARFSDHEMVESQRARAVAALVVLAQRITPAGAGRLPPKTTPALDSLAL